MQQKDMITGQELAVRKQGRMHRVKVLRLRVARNPYSRADSVEVEYLDKPWAGETVTIAARDIDMTWEKAAPIQAERDRKEQIDDDLARDGAKRVQELATKIMSLTGIEPNVALDRGREIGRTPANRVIRQAPGARITLDTEAVEELVERVVSADV